MTNTGNVFVPGEYDWTQGCLTDTFKIAAATAFPAKVNFLVDPVNTAGKLVGDTNMTKSKELPNGEVFIVQSIRLSFLDCAEADIIAFMKAYMTRLWVGKQIYAEGPADYFPAGGGLWAALGGEVAAAVHVHNNGLPDPRSVNLLDPENEIPLRPGTTFFFEAEGTTFNTAAAMFIRLILDGKRGRPAQ